MADSDRGPAGAAGPGGNRHLLSVYPYHYARGGAGQAYLAHGDLMAQHGWTNHCSSMKHAENLPCEDEDLFADEINIGADIGPMTKLLHAQRIIYSFEAKAKMAKMLDRYPIDLAHVHAVYHHQSPSVLVELKQRRIPIVMTAHDLKLACPAYTMSNSKGVCEQCKGGKVWNVAVNRCIKGSLAASALIMVESAVHKALRIYDRTASKIVVPSLFYGRKLAEWGWSPDKLVYIPNFVEFASETPRPRVGGYLLYFGRLSPEKGLKTLLQAACLSGIPVKIAGQGPQEAELRAYAETLGAPVEFLGFCSGEALWSVVDGARAVVLPSEWYENAPLSIIEAFGRGKPLIGANIGGIPELIEPGVTGWLFNAADVAHLAEAMAHCISAPDAELLSMGQVAQERALAQYAPARYAKAMNDLYGQLLS